MQVDTRAGRPPEQSLRRKEIVTPDTGQSLHQTLGGEPSAYRSQSPSTRCSRRPRRGEPEPSQTPAVGGRITRQLVVIAQTPVDLPRQTPGGR